MSRAKKISFLSAIILFFTSLNEAYDPCQGKNQIGGQCDRDYDCTGFGVVCKSGRCDCHANYQSKTDTDGSKYCSKLPDVIGAPCSGQCRYPMFCNNGQCQCVRNQADGPRCYPKSQLGDQCSQDADCAQPFTSCSGGRCNCIAGTSSNGGQCVAAPKCPDGARPGGTCVRTTYDRSSIQNTFDNKNLDTCPSGSYCYTNDVSLGGHCCPISCPYNTAPNTGYSCAPKASNPCPVDTHFCHRLAGQTFSVSACCQRPCKDPTPLYVNGRCFARTWLGGPCASNEQCLGGDTMQCSNGQCICKPGFSPETGTFISADNPPQTCVKGCGSSPSRGGECFSSSSLGSQCDVDDQCPSNSKCLRGTCVCNCLAGYSNVGGSCARPPPTTQAPGTVTNSGSGGIAGLLGGLLNGKGSGTSGGSGGGLAGLLGGGGSGGGR